MKMHPYYTEIPQRSFDAIVKAGLLSELLLAFVTDPLNAEDIADCIVEREETRIYVNLNKRKIAAPILISDIVGLPIEAPLTRAEITISQWVMAQKIQPSQSPN